MPDFHCFVAVNTPPMPYDSDDSYGQYLIFDIVLRPIFDIVLGPIVDI